MFSIHMLNCVRHVALQLVVAVALLASAGSLAAQTQLLTDFYGKQVSVLKIFGQTSWQSASPGEVNAEKIFHAAGVHVDRQGHIYVADTGNNRILGFRAYQQPNQAADLVIGQPDFHSGAANGDANLGYFKPTSASQLCLTAYPATNVAEQWMRVNFDTDTNGNLVIPDFYNNRVLVYRAPYSTDKSNGAGDSIADFVIGQDNFSANGINKGMGENQRNASSLWTGLGPPDYVASRGVSFDSQNNVWVADTFNSRVLRFPPNSKTADLVIGQADFTSKISTWQLTGNLASAPLNRLGSPSICRVNPDTGELWVVDEFPGGFKARILVFQPPFSNGMTASRIFVPAQQLQGDYANGYTFSHCTGLHFNTFKTDDPVDLNNPNGPKYRDGIVWIHDQTRTLLLDTNGNILVSIAAPNNTSLGGQFGYYGNCNMDPLAPFNLISPGGNIGFESNHIWLADEGTDRVARFDLPYRITGSSSTVCLPEASGGLFGKQTLAGPLPNDINSATFKQDNSGLITFGNQLIVRDLQRYMVWQNYMTKHNGSAADIFVGQPDGNIISNRNHIIGFSMHAIDDQNRLWCTGEHGKLMVYPVPMQGGTQPLRELIPLYWADTSEEIDYSCGRPVTWDAQRRHIWLFDNSHHRLLRISNPDAVANGGRLLVDAVIGQNNKIDSEINRGMAQPDASSLGDVNDIKFDRRGNLFVVDNTYECHLNGRVMSFLSEDLSVINSLFPAIQAKRLYVATQFNQTDICRSAQEYLIQGDSPFSPVSIAFNSRNEMVMGNDGYHRDPQLRPLRQLYLYRDPLQKATPDAIIELPLGAPAEMKFDDRDNLVVQDHTWNRVFVINYDRDPVWLRPLPDNVATDNVPRVRALAPVSLVSRPEESVSCDGWLFDTQGSDDIAQAELAVFDPAHPEERRLNFRYDVQQNLLYGFENGQWVGGFAPQSNNFLITDTGTLTCADTKVTKQGNDFVVHWKISTGPSIIGNRTVALRAIDQAGHTSSWVNAGSWLISEMGALPTLSVNDITVQEGNTGTRNALFTVTLSEASPQTVNVEFAVQGGTAKAGSDYITSSGTLTFDPGETTKTANLSITSDTLDELDETFLVLLSNPTNATLADGIGKGIIADDDQGPTVSINNVTVIEGNSGTKNATFTVTLSAASGKTVAVDAIPYDGTARTPADYTSGGARLVFAPGEVSKTFSVPIKGDVLDEADETVYTILSSPGNATLGTARGVCTIKDDDPTPSISIDDVHIGEGNSGQRTAVFRLRLSAPSGQVVKVNYATANDAALAGSDYVAVPSTQIAFTTGTVYVYARFLVNGDLLNEPNETFKVKLSSAVNATIADSQALGTILNDDSAPSLTINDVSVTEGNSGTKVLTFTVTLSKASGQTVTVNYATADGIARSTSDYVAKSDKLTFAAGTTSQTIAVMLNSDTLKEADETLYVLLSGAVNATGSKARGIGTIRNDDF